MESHFIFKRSNILFLFQIDELQRCGADVLRSLQSKDLTEKSNFDSKNNDAQQFRSISGKVLSSP